MAFIELCPEPVADLFLGIRANDVSSYTKAFLEFNQIVDDSLLGYGAM
jgi:hypothetical protein